MSKKLSAFFNKKLVFGLVFLGFSIFWFGDFIDAFFYMIVFPVAFYFYEKNNSEIESISENHSYITFTTTLIVASYVVFSVHYLSIQNPNKAFNKNNLVVETYYIPEYKSVRTRSDYVLLVKNEKDNIAIDCSAFTYGECPYAHQYNDNIDIGFIEVRKTFNRFIFGLDNAKIAYYIKYKNEIVPSEYFVKKYDNEMKKVILFLISLNLYMIFLYCIKKIYGFHLQKSFLDVFSSKKKSIYFIYLNLLVFMPIIVKFIL